MANLKCHIPIMVNEAVYAMQFSTGLNSRSITPIVKHELYTIHDSNRET